MKTVIDILYGWLLTTATCTALGWLLVGCLGLRLKRVERFPLSFVVGAAAMSGLMFALCALHLARRGVLQVLGLAIIAAAAWTWKKSRADVEPGGPLRKHWLFLAGFGAFAAVYFFNALAPEVSPDGMAYHLEVVGAFARAHGFAHLRPTVFSYLPQGVEMLFLFAYEFGGHSAAAMAHLSFLLTLPWLALCFGDRFGMRDAGVFAGLLAFASPIAGIDGVSAYNDVALAASAFGLFYLLQIWRETGHRGTLIAAGLVAGFCAATKYTGAVVLAYAMCYAAWCGRRPAVAALRNAAAAALPAALIALPWLIRNWLSTGNPVLPVLSHWFANPYVSPDIEHALRAMALEGSYQTGRWRGLWESVVHGANPGLIGPVFLAAPLGLLALRDPMGRRLLAAAVFLLAAFVVNSDTRFLIPLLVFLALPMAIALERLRQRIMVLAGLHLILSWYTVVPLYAAPQWNIREVPVRAALRLTPEEEFFERRAPEYFVARMVESQTPPGSAILAMSALPAAYTSRTVQAGFQDSISYNMLIWVMRALSPPDVEECRFEFPARDVRGVRLVAAGAGEWRVDELRFWSRGRELPRRPGWRLRADPNSWDVQLAFDNNPLTFWGPGEPVRPGMWMEARFDVAASLDTVAMRTQKGQAGQVRLMALDASGVWRKVDATRTCGAAPAGAGLRRMAIRELKDRGTGYLTIADEDPAARDLQYNRAAWGLVEVAEFDGNRLYRLE